MARNALFALLLALRLLGSAGYMPAVEGGTLTIVVCPDADVNAPLALGTGRHHRGHAKHGHNLCPYAAAGALGAVANERSPLPAMIFLAAALLLGGTWLLAERQIRRARPPTRAPPIFT